MNAALDDVKMNDRIRPALIQFFEHVAKFLVNVPDDADHVVVQH